MTFPCSCAIALLRNTPEHISGSLWEWNQNEECFNIKTLYLPTCVLRQRTKRDIGSMDTLYIVSHTAAGWSATRKQHTGYWIKSAPYEYNEWLLSHGLMVESRTHNPKVVSSSRGPAGIVGGGSACTVLSPPSIPRLRFPWARHRTPNCSPDAAA